MDGLMELRGVIEAMLFVAEDPIPVTEMAEVMEQPLRGIENLRSRQFLVFGDVPCTYPRHSGPSV